MAKIQEIAPELLQFSKATAPSTPTSGIVRIYAKTDGLIYSKDDTGVETCLGIQAAYNSRILALELPTIVAVSGSKTLALTDIGTIQKATAAATITVPPNSTVAFSISTQISIVNMSSGDIAIAAGSDVTIRSKGGNLKIDGQYAAVTLTKIATDEWLLVGALKA